MSDAQTKEHRRTPQEEGDLQILAGVSLVSASKLLDWDTDAHRFICNADSGTFLGAWTQLDPVFGRVLLWNAFSAGAEYLLKGVVLVNGKEIREGAPSKVKAYPDTDEAKLKAWAARCYSEKLPREKRLRELREKRLREKREHRQRADTEGKSGQPSPAMSPIPTMDVIQFGTLNKLVENTRTIDEIAKSYAPSEDDGDAAKEAFQAEVEIVFAAFDLLRETIRNRDAHAYVPNVRDSHLHLVKALFMRAFNTLLSWIPPAHCGENITQRYANRELIVHRRKREPEEDDPLLPPHRELPPRRDS